MKALILGVGNAQVDAIEYCKARGWEVHGLSYCEEGAGLSLVDHFGLVNIVDADAVQAYAERINADLVYSVGSDIAMPTVGVVCERMGLPLFVSQKTAKLMQCKGDLRQFLKKRDISPVPFMVGQTLSDFSDWNMYPAIIKPVDGQGQRGVYELNSADDLQQYFLKAKSHSRCGDVIVERYICGPEISVNVFVRDGQVEDAFVSDRYVVENLPGGIVSGHGLPSVQTESVQDQARELAAKCVAALKISNGPVYFQMKVQDEKVFIIEITPRLDGCHMWRLIYHKHGVNLLDKSFALLSGRGEMGPEKSTAEGQWRLEFSRQPPGCVFEKKNHNDDTVFSSDYYHEGDVVLPINGHMEKTGYRIYQV